jgi:putative ABC transport system permease protein
VIQAILRNPNSQFGTGLQDLLLGLENLRVHKLRSLLTMLGMIFGVAAVVAMLSIGAGAQQQVMAFIEQLGVRNVIVEARETTEPQAFGKVRSSSPGLTFQDYRVIRATMEGVTAASPRKRFQPSKMLPKPQRNMPTVYGVTPSYIPIGNLRLTAGRFFDDNETERAAPVAVLGEGAKAALFGPDEAVGQHIKVNDQWLRVIGVAGPQISAETASLGVPEEDRNNLLYVPLWTVMLRLEDNYSRFRDEIDGIYLQLEPGVDSVAGAEAIRGVLNASHRNTPDFSVIVPAALLAEQRRTQRIFEVVMVALASISLLVGGIGIMNIMLASILERTREIGVRRALGARRSDIVRQFLIETILISFVGGTIGVIVGVGISRLIGLFAGWSTIVTASSILLAFLVSVTVGLVFGLYPARRAAHLDPIEALRYE